MSNQSMVTTSSSVVQFQAVSFSLPTGRALLHDLDFSLDAGETLVLLGRSGSGKTTTLRLINRLLEPTRGSVLVQGKPTTAWDPVRLRRHIGYVIQETGLFPHFTIERNVALVPELEGWPAPRRRKRAYELLELVGLNPEQFASRYPDELSGGQRQRVGIARALAADPAIVLMDEPFGALDPVTRMELQREFAQLVRRLQKTIVFVTHDVTEAFVLASRIGLFHQGHLVALATPHEFSRSHHHEVRAFLESIPRLAEPMAASRAGLEGA